MEKDIIIMLDIMSSLCERKTRDLVKSYNINFGAKDRMYLCHRVPPRDKLMELTVQIIKAKGVHIMEYNEEILDQTIQTLQRNLELLNQIKEIMKVGTEDVQKRSNDDK